MQELDNIYYGELFHIYGKLLSPTQQEILNDYLYFDLSITEIAENKGISRSAVEDAIKKGKRKLQQFEDIIQMNKVNEFIKTELNEEQLAKLERILK